MIKEKAIRNLMAIAYTLAVTFAIGKWAICKAFFERGYEAIGGEYCLMLMAGKLAWKAINYLFDTMEDLRYEQNCKKRGYRKTPRLQNNRWTI